METGIHAGISNNDYHSMPGISKSGLSKIKKSPAHYQVYLNEKSEPTKAMNFGSAFHTTLLEPEKFNSEIAVSKKIDKRTKSGKEAFAVFQTESEGKIIIDQGEMDTIHEMSKSVQAHETASNIIAGDIIESSAFWNDPIYGFLSKCRPDSMCPEIKILADLKSCMDASPKEFAKACANYGYHIQAAWYLDGVNQAQSDVIYTDFLFVAVEKTPPYGVAVYRATPEMLEKGREEIREISKTYAECLESGIWPAYGDNVQDINLPRWAQ